MADGARKPDTNYGPDIRFTLVFEQATPRLRRFLAGLEFAPADADDILQDVFLEMCRSPEAYRDPRTAEHWLLRVTVNRGRLEYRRR